MRLKPFAFGILALVIFLGTTFSAQTMGIWSVSGKATSSGEKIVATGANPDEIKGWMTIGEVSDAYGFSVEDLAEQFGIPADTDPGTQIKELESETFSPEALRTWLEVRQRE